MTRLPISLDLCPQRFAEMSPEGDRTRYCGACDKSVHDLSAMTSAEAAALLHRRSDLCVRYLYDRSGRPVHRPTHRAKAWLAAVALAVTPVLIEACGGAPRGYDYQPVMEAESESESVSESVSEAASESGSESVSEAAFESESECESASGSASESGSESEAGSESECEAESGSDVGSGGWGGGESE